jgi:hypothetical protein
MKYASHNEVRFANVILLRKASGRAFTAGEAHHYITGKARTFTAGEAHNFISCEARIFTAKQLHLT